MEDKKLTSHKLNIDEDDVKVEADLEVLFNWKHQTKKEVNRMKDKIDITKERKGDINPSMIRAIRCQELFLEMIEDRIKIIEYGC